MRIVTKTRLIYLTQQEILQFHFHFHYLSHQYGESLDNIWKSLTKLADKYTSFRENVQKSTERVVATVTMTVADEIIKRVLPKKEAVRDRAVDLSKIKPFPKTKPSPVVFPANPVNFNPRGLTLNRELGTKNGAVIHWDTAKGKTIFRWDEDLKHGSHYHVIPISGIHFFPGMEVPEPFARIYFR
jgi:hypothetical protein